MKIQIKSNSKVANAERKRHEYREMEKKTYSRICKDGKTTFMSHTHRFYLNSIAFNSFALPTAFCFIFLWSKHQIHKHFFPLVRFIFSVLALLLYFSILKFQQWASKIIATHNNQINIRVYMPYKLRIKFYKYRMR